MSGPGTPKKLGWLQNKNVSVELSDTEVDGPLKKTETASPLL